MKEEKSEHIQLKYSISSAIQFWNLENHQAKHRETIEINEPVSKIYIKDKIVRQNNQWISEWSQLEPVEKEMKFRWTGHIMGKRVNNCCGDAMLSANI